MSNMAKFVSALIVFLLMTLVASRQLFLIVGMRDPSGLSLAGGKSHLWLAAIAGIIACVSGGLMFYFFSRHEKNRQSKVEMTSAGPLITLMTVKQPNSPAPAAFNVVRWTLANPWLAEGRPDDRTPMDGSVRDNGGTPSEQRAFARRTHQLMFKKWSQARHD